MKYVKTFENFTYEPVNEEFLGRAIEKAKNWIANKFEAFAEEHPEVKEAFEKVKEAARNLSEEDREKLVSADPEELAPALESLSLQRGNMINEGMFMKAVAFLGLGTSGAAFLSAIAVCVKAAIGAGFYTFGLPVGVIVAICMGIFAVTGFIGKSAYDAEFD